MATIGWSSPRQTASRGASGGVRIVRPPRRYGAAGNSAHVSGQARGQVPRALKSTSCWPPWMRSSGSSMSSTMRRSTSGMLSQNRFRHGGHHARGRTGSGRFSRRLTVACAHRSAPRSGKRPRAILKADRSAGRRSRRRPDSRPRSAGRQRIVSAGACRMRSGARGSSMLRARRSEIAPALDLGREENAGPAREPLAMPESAVGAPMAEIEPPWSGQAPRTAQHCLL